MQVIKKNTELAELDGWVRRIWDVATGFGLDPYPTHFEVVPASMMYEFGAYGLPGRFSHWTHGRDYYRMKTQYDYGLSTIYELVINTDPCQAFLMEANSLLENKLVIAHVLAHCDFFRHNALFAKTNRQMAETAALHAERIREYAFKHGELTVERFLDAVLSIEDHVESFAFPERPEPTDAEKRRAKEGRQTPYDDLFAPVPGAPEPPNATKRVPPEPQRDLLRFLAEHAELEDWQRDVLMSVRAERLYFEPQMRTKILNEGWASYWHSRILRALDLPSDEYADFARLHAGILAPSRTSYNPYYLGMALLEHVEQRWETPSDKDKERLGLLGGQGREKLFALRDLESDVSFVREYLTKDTVKDLDLYTYEYKDGQWVVTDKDWKRVRDTLVGQLTTYGTPYITVEDGNHQNRRELLLKHHWDGNELDAEYAKRTLVHLHFLWKRPVSLVTRNAIGHIITWSYDGSVLNGTVTNPPAPEALLHV